MNEEEGQIVENTTQHLQQSLEVEEVELKNRHVREALQLLQRLRES